MRIAHKAGSAETIIGFCKDIMNTNHKDVAHEAAQTEETVTPEISEETTVQNTAEEEAFKAQFMRVSADFANYKRRITEERTQWIAAGQSAVITKFLPILDDIERARTATEAAHNASDAADLTHAVEGFALIEKNLKKILTDLGVEEIDCSGAFDPHFHEALMQAESDEHESGHIVSVLNRGYTYKDTVLRHAKVSVAQ